LRSRKRRNVSATGKSQYEKDEADSRKKLHDMARSS
jgi:hypothetical protein